MLFLFGTLVFAALLSNGVDAFSVSRQDQKAQVISSSSPLGSFSSFPSVSRSSIPVSSLRSTKLDDATEATEGLSSQDKTVISKPMPFMNFPRDDWTLDSAWQVLDRNGDGTLDWNDVRHFQQEIVQALDRNGDGKLDHQDLFHELSELKEALFSKSVSIDRKKLTQAWNVACVIAVVTLCAPGIAAAKGGGGGGRGGGGGGGGGGVSFSSYSYSRSVSSSSRPYTSYDDSIGRTHPEDESGAGLLVVLGLQAAGGLVNAGKELKEYIEEEWDNMDHSVPPSGRYAGYTNESDGAVQDVSTRLTFEEDGRIVGRGYDSDDGHYTLSGTWTGRKVSWTELYDDRFVVNVQGRIKRNGDIRCNFESSRGVKGSFILSLEE